MNRFRLLEEKKRFEEGERQDLERKLAPVKQQLAATMQKADRMTRMFWSQDLKHLSGLIQKGLFEQDANVKFPTTDDPKAGSLGREQFQDFVTATLPRQGFVLSEAGSQRLLLYVVANAMGENRADMSEPSTWQIAFDRLYRLEIFDERGGEVGYDESQRVVEPGMVQPAPEPTLDDLERIDCGSREGAKIANDILSRHVFQGAARDVFRQFVAHVKKTFGHEMTEDQQKAVIDWFIANNRSFLDFRSYDQAKVNLVRRGILPQECLTEEEILAGSIENEDTSSWESRRRLKAELVAARNRN